MIKKKHEKRKSRQSTLLIEYYRKSLVEKIPMIRNYFFHNSN